MLMIDCEDVSLSAEDQSLLQHPAIAGVILFSRNYHDPQQLMNLCQAIRQVREDLLIAVDQEGGRVQRFREGFINHPPLATFGKLYQEQPEQAKYFSAIAAWLLASEILACGVDFSFTPVLDRFTETSKVIKDRAFANDINVIVDLAKTYIASLHDAGMRVCAKHFPGHGTVVADSHLEMPIDRREKSLIFKQDMQTFASLITQLDAIMPAHVIYPAVDNLPASFSATWLQTILREQLHFSGLIFSDDISMQAASMMGDYPTRVTAALAAGCDIVLLCNNRKAVINVLDEVAIQITPQLQQRIQHMRAQKKCDWQQLHQSPAWQSNQELIASLLEEVR